MRREKILVIDRPGRDVGKTFVLREMSAMRAEKWATRALLALSRSGIQIDSEVIAGGLAALAMVGVRSLSGVSFSEAEPLMDEMMARCVLFQPNPMEPSVRRELIEDDIDEVQTLARIRAELLELHTGFSIPVILLKSISAPETGGAISTTPTSPVPSGV